MTHLAEKKRERKEKIDEAKPKPNNVERGVASGRPLEDLSQVGSTMVKAPPAISAIEGL